MLVSPLAVTTIGIQQLNTLALENNDFSTTRYLDTNHITSIDLYSTIISIEAWFNHDYKTDPVRLVTDAQFSLDLITLSFSVVFEERDFEAFLRLNLRTTYIPTSVPKRRKDAIILTGSLKEWLSEIKIFLLTDKYHTERVLLNQVYIWLKKIKLNLLLSKYKEVNLPDGTFLLERTSR